MKQLLLAAVAIVGLMSSAHADLIASFSQNPSLTPTVTATDNGTTTNIVVTDASTSITTGLSGVIPAAIFDLNATSVSAATQLGTQIIQLYSGTFCFTSLNGCTGTNYISGVFTDATFGAAGGPGLTLNVNNPPDTLTLTSDVVSPSRLLAPSSFNLDFADLLPLLHIDGTTIGAFTANFAGNISASSVATPEPLSLAVLGVGMLGLSFVRRRA
jgi:hypothetical protein